MNSLQKIVLVTGGSKGIGHSIISLFSKKSEEFKVYCFDIIPPVKPIPSVTYIDCDISSEKSIESSISKITENYLNILINNAGVFINEPIEKISIELFDKILAINLRAPFIISKLCLPLFKNVQNSCIINIASTRGIMSEPNNEAYSSSKSGLIGLTHALANSLGPKIRVNCISPGWINVKEDELIREIDKKQHPVGRVGDPNDIANMCLFLADENLSGFITGQNFVIDGGMTKKMIYEE